MIATASSLPGGRPVVAGVTAISVPAPTNRFLEKETAPHRRVAHRGRLSGLAQVRRRDFIVSAVIGQPSLKSRWR